jgi:hypothetical protein
VSGDLEARVAALLAHAGVSTRQARPGGGAAGWPFAPPEPPDLAAL